MPEKQKRIVKTIRIDVDKCNGCRACEMICSAFHATPKYSSNAPGRARIHITTDPMRDLYIPVYAGQYTASECMGRNIYIIDGKQYDECGLCKAACPSRTQFHEPDSGLPLRCDMCEDDPPQPEPLCVQWCINDTLVYEEREIEVAEETRQEDVEVGVISMIDKYGLQKVMDTVTRLAASKKGRRWEQ